MKRIALFYNEEKKEAIKLIKDLSHWLKKHGVQPVIVRDNNRIPKGVDCAIALGGDGTMLKVARRIAVDHIPLFGVNIGRLGFLAEMDWHHLYPVLEDVIAGNYHVERRCMLSVDIRPALTKNKNRQISSQHLALNDCVIKCGGNARLIELDVWVGKKFLSAYNGDGLIVATPTGSTAYSLAANGPLVHPTLDVLIVNPICPHTLAQRPLLIPSNQMVHVQVREHDPHASVIVSLDGQQNFRVREKSEIIIKKAPYELLLIANPHEHYFSILRKKLGWGSHKAYQMLRGAYSHD